MYTAMPEHLLTHRPDVPDLEAREIWGIPQIRLTNSVMNGLMVSLFGVFPTVRSFHLQKSDPKDHAVYLYLDIHTHDLNIDIDQPHLNRVARACGIIILNLIKPANYRPEQEGGNPNYMHRTFWKYEAKSAHATVQSAHDLQSRLDAAPREIQLLYRILKAHISAYQ